MELGWIILGVLVLVAFVGGLVCLVLFLSKFLGGTTGGWGRLLEAYETTEPPPAEIFTRRIVQMGAVTYNRCVTLGATDRGLYVKIRQKAILIPWSEFKMIESTTLHWQKVPMLTIGQPPVATMTIPKDVFATMQTQLPKSLGRASPA